MAANLPPFVRGQGGSAIASYNWKDILQNAGYVTVYGTASSVLFYLTPEVIVGFPTYSDAADHLEVNFDMTFNVPAYVQGDALITCVSQGLTNPHYAVATIYHVDLAAAETSLGTYSYSASPQAGGTDWTWSFNIPITGKHFSIGEKIRLSINLDHSAGATTVRLYHEPSTAGPKCPVFHIPFRIDLS